jgi:type I restriction enzyme M protein
VVLANGSLSTQQKGEGEIRRRMVDDDVVDCIVALPTRLFYTTGIPACLWFLGRGRGNGRFRDRRGEVLFIDARDMGQMVTRTHRALTDEDIAIIADTYHAWRGEDEAGAYEDVPGFARSATLDEIAEHHYVLTPGRYVGTIIEEGDGEPFEEKMTRLTADLAELFAENAELEERIRRNLEEFGYGV